MADLEEITELTLGLPGGGGRRERATAPPLPPPEVVSGTVKSEMLISHKRGLVGEDDNADLLSSNNGGSTSESAPAKKAQAIGWPPVRSFRKKAFTESRKYVKVAADGVPYLRKLDLETYECYEELLRTLKDMFSCFNILGNCNTKKIDKFQVKGMVEYVPTYVDKDDDLMLVGDVPWKMFTESCKRIRLMKSSEAVGLASRTAQNI